MRIILKLMNIELFAFFEILNLGKVKSFLLHFIVKLGIDFCYHIPNKIFIPTFSADVIKIQNNSLFY